MSAPKYCDDPDICTYSDCPTAFCDRNASIHSPHRLARRWQWSWHRCKPFKIRVALWGDKRLTVQKGFHVWLGWWRLSAIYLEQEAPNDQIRRVADHPATPKLNAPATSPASNGSAVLCYVDGHWAYFTTRKLSEQWGDDWNDAPYEHNAGTPYEYHEHDKKEGLEPWAISKVAFDGDFETPCEGLCNSPWSVEQINAGAVAWLRTSKWNKTQSIIPSGTTLARFCELIAQGGGQTYLPNGELSDRTPKTNNDRTAT